MDMDASPHSSAGCASNEPSRFDRWQRRLLDLSLRNSMLNAPLRSRQFELLLPDIAAFEDQLSSGRRFRLDAFHAEAPAQQSARGGKKTAAAEAPTKSGEEEPGEAPQDALSDPRLKSKLEEMAQSAFARRHLCCVYRGRGAAERRLLQLYREARNNLEELGCNTLFVTVGLLRWQQEKEPERYHYAPLLLFPVAMSRTGTTYSIAQADGEPRFNLTLLELLRQEFSLSIPALEGALPEDEAGVDVPKVLGFVREAIREREGWAVEERCTLGTFSFAKFLMWRDMTERRDELEKNLLVRHIADGHRGAFPDQENFPGVHELEHLIPASQICAPLSSDSSQLAAVVAAARGKSFVLVGPPGTGKSQTIANMIAQCCSQGKSVLFVAEKSAALNVVYKRLCRIGLGDFCLELHSNKADRAKALRQFAAVRDLVADFRDEDWTDAAARLQQGREELDAVADALHRKQPEGTSLYTLLVRSLMAEALPSLPLPKGCRPPALDVRGADAEVQHHAALLAAAAKPVCEQLGGALEHLSLSPGAQAHELDELATGLSELAESLQRVVEAAARLEASMHLPTTEELTAERADALIKLADFAGKRAATPGVAFEQLVELMSDYRRAASRLSVPYEKDAELTAGLDEWRHRWREAQLSWIVLRWFKMRKLRKQLAALAERPPRAEHLGRDLDALIAMAEARRAFEALTPELSRLPHATEELSRALDSRQKQIAALAQRGWLIERGLSRAVGKQLDGVRSILENRRLWRDWSIWRDTADESRSQGYGELVVWLEQRACPPEQLVQRTSATYARRRAEAVIAANPVLSRFSTQLHEHRIEAFRTRDDALMTLAVGYVRHCLFRRASAIRDASCQDELNLLQRELSKSRGHLPLRRLISSLPRTFTLLKPCVLMSPLSAAQYLDAKREPFDVVIFDEASQIPVWDAVGAIARGRSAVIVGDPRQMPPTSFFSKQEGETDEPEELEQDLESILDECIACGVPSMNLRWHFRSRSESLIAFSNERYYDGSLITFPNASTDDAALQLHEVAGIYERGTSRTNPTEARALVEHVIATLKSPGFTYTEMTSIGIVTFNTQQQELIADLLDEARAADPSLEPYFDENLPEAIFVKNLESVQGDERGVIYFSTTFGPDPSGSVSMNFGPLNRKGGERRLNVAVTRSRAQMHVFSSLRPEMIDLAHTQARGAADLRAFLEWAASAERVARGAAPVADQGGEDDKLPDLVAAALETRGWTCRCRPGISDRRIDVAVVDPQHPDSYLAAIEIDNEPEEQTARDRDKLRDAVLEGLGWELIHLWALDWWRDPARETERLHAALERLEARGPKPPTEYPDLVAAAERSDDSEERTERADADGEAEQGMPRLDDYEAFAGGVANPGEFSDAAFAKLMLQALAAEGPVVPSRLAAALCAKPTAALVRRVCQKVRRVAESLRQQGELCEEEQRIEGGAVSVYRLPNQPTCRLRSRGPRDWDEIPPEEIRAAAEIARVHGKAFTGTDDHLRKTARLFGKVRMTASVTEALRRAVSC